MTVSELKRLCGAMAGAGQTLYGAPSNILVYAVDDKKFAYFKTSAPEQWRFSLRVSADRFLELTDVPGIKPARYMGRFHWITIVDPNTLPRDYLLELLAWSHAKAMQSLSAKRRAEIAAMA